MNRIDSPPAVLLVVLGVACSSTTPSISASSSSSGGPAVDGGPTGCPVLLDGCFAYACTCKSGQFFPQISGTAPSGVCESAAAACARTCVNVGGAATFACGPAPVLKDAGSDVAPRPQCMAGFCNFFATVTCKDSSAIYSLDSECPDSGLCPYVADEAEAKCADHGGVESHSP